MNSYKKLVNNSLIFAIGTLGSRLVSFILVPLYTHYLTTSEYGTVDLTITTVNMLLPIISLSIYDAILRFTMDKNENPKEVLTNSILIAVGGYTASLIFFPIFSYFNVLQGNLKYLYLILFVQIFERILAQYIRALGKIKIFAFNGILLTLSTGILNILFIVFMDMGIVGFYWAIILSYLLSIIFLVFYPKTYKDLFFSYKNNKKINELIYYAVPMIPNSLMWWLINASSRYFIIGFVGINANGLFAVASRIPSILTIFYQIFNQAWQLSAIEEYENKNKSDFYSSVFSNLSSFMFLGASFLVVFIKYLFNVLFASDYFMAWTVVPFLLLGTIFSSFSSFLGTNYVAAKQTKGVFKTSVYGGIISLLLNFIFIPTIGLIGAGISSMFSFLVMFLIRYFDTRQYIQIKINWFKLIANTSIVLLQIGLLFLGLNSTLELVFGIIIWIILLFNNKHLEILIKKSIQIVLKKFSK